MQEIDGPLHRALRSRKSSRATHVWIVATHGATQRANKAVIHQSAFDSSKIKVENRALGGRSSRTFQTEGLWAKIVANMKTGDFVLMQFGHNDGGPLDSGRARASLKGIGDETREIVDAKGNKEIVHTYGWYMKKYCTDAKDMGATPIVVSPIPRNNWKDNKVARASKDYGKWSDESAKATGLAFVDLNEIVAVDHENLGKE